MILWWIGDIVLLLVVLPVVVYLLRGVLDAATAIVPSVQGIAKVAAAGSKDLDAAALLLTTQDQATKTVAGVANYGGSLDVILDDASYFPRINARGDSEANMRGEIADLELLAPTTTDRHVNRVYPGQVAREKP